MNYLQRRMKLQLTYSKALNDLWQWIEENNARFHSNKQIFHSVSEVKRVKELIRIVVTHIEYEFVFHSKELITVEQTLFYQQGYNGFLINSCVFGELYSIIKYVLTASHNDFWANIHPRIIKTSLALYADGYFDSAAEKAMREVETYLRELFANLKNASVEPMGVNEVMNALLNDGNIYSFDMSTVSGKDYFKGIKGLFESSNSAYRNPASHRNLPCSKREAFERITLASQLIYILEEHRK